MTALTKNKTKITLGTVVKIWHGTRGHDYVVVGLDTKLRKVHLLKHNSINQDGSIHSGTAKSFYTHKALSYNTHGIISKISTVQGQCKRLDVDKLQAHFKGTEIDVTSFASTKLYSTAFTDRRDFGAY